MKTEAQQEQMREWRAQHVSTRINGKTVYLHAPNKRAKTEECEVCGRDTPHLTYHHWYHGRPSLGLWVCCSCHHFVEGVDKGLVDRYLTSRSRIEAEMSELR